MLLSRIIPCLLVRNSGLVKTVHFTNPKYVGDPINAVKIFNEKGVDELMVLDIDATVFKKEPDYHLITKLATECRMPLCYGGGVKTVEQVRRIIGLGVEKVAISSAAIYDLDIIERAVKIVGTQSVVVVMDVMKEDYDGTYSLWTHNGHKKAGLSAVEFAKQVERIGVGEVVVNSIDRDGSMKGYDFDLVKAIRATINCPITILGGAGSLKDIEALIHTFGTIGAAAGSLFVFKGKYRAVLISYPSRVD
jgi:cyclase